MPALDSPRAQMRYSAPVFLASTLIYWAFRLLGANKEHAWDSAKLVTVNAIMDKVVEKAGIADPRHKGKDGVQAYFEDGFLDGATRFIEGGCGAVTIVNPMLPASDPRRHIYRATDRRRGQQTVFEYLGQMVPPDRASALKDVVLDRTDRAA